MNTLHSSATEVKSTPAAVLSRGLGQRHAFFQKLVAAVFSMVLVAGLTMPAVAKAASDEVLLKEVGSLLIENRGIATKIATQLGFAVSSTTPGSGTQAEMNNALAVRNQMLFKQIASKLGVEVLTEVPTLPTLIEQTHATLRGNRIVTKAIMAALGLDSLSPLAMKGSLVEQNRDLLLGNRAGMKRIAIELGAM
jgi:hypothetical protein